MAYLTEYPISRNYFDPYIDITWLKDMIHNQAEDPLKFQEAIINMQLEFEQRVKEMSLKPITDHSHG